MQTCRYLPAPDDMSALKIAFEIYMKFGDFANALRIALLLDDKVGE
jgi:26S proteasome regulatory subunit N1